jgi:hypothetical protein
MAKVPMTKEAAKALAAEVKLQSPDYGLLALVPVEKQDAARLWMRMKAQFTPYQHAAADAFEYCERRQSDSNDDRDEIIAEAAAQFFDRVPTKLKKTLADFTESVHRAWQGRNWDEVNKLRELRAAARLLHGSV